jgi:hypothetical protein
MRILRVVPALLLAGSATALMGADAPADGQQILAGMEQAVRDDVGDIVPLATFSLQPGELALQFNMAEYVVLLRDMRIRYLAPMGEHDGFLFCFSVRGPGSAPAAKEEGTPDPYWKRRTRTHALDGGGCVLETVFTGTQADTNVVARIEGVFERHLKSLAGGADTEPAPAEQPAQPPPEEPAGDEAQETPPAETGD